MTISASVERCWYNRSGYISVGSTSTGTDELTLDFDMGDGDGKVDVLTTWNGGGKDYVIVRNFETGTDKVHFDGACNNTDQYDTGCYGCCNPYSGCIGCLRLANVADVSHQSGASANLLSAVWTYNGDSYFL